MTKASQMEWTWPEIKRLALRRRWYFLAPLFVLGLGGAVVPHFMQPRYQSTALIHIQQQQVPSKYVSPNVTTSAADRLQAIQEQVLSRARLQTLIDSMGLYPGERAHHTMDEIVDEMAQDITITSVTATDQPDQLTGFSIAYTAPSPATAQRVVNELTSMFISDNLKARSQQSASTTQFLQGQLQDAKQKLDQADTALRQYKLQYLGQLPEQQQGNLEILTNLRTQYQAESDALSRAQQEKTYYESLQAQYAADPKAARAAPDPESPAAKLQLAQSKLAALEASHTDKYPDVVAAKQEVAKWQGLAAAAPQTGSGASPTQPALIEAGSRLKALDLEIAGRQKTLATLEQRIQAVSNQLNLTPVREQALATLQQTFNDAQKNYQSLLGRDQESQLATDLEESQQGERFALVNPASLPRTPVSPNRLLLLLGGWILGILAGAGLVMLREFTDGSLTGERDLGRITPVPVLAAIPTLSSPGRLRRSRRHWGLEGAAVLCLAALAVGSIVVNILGS